MVSLALRVLGGIAKFMWVVDKTNVGFASARLLTKPRKLTARPDCKRVQYLPNIHSHISYTYLDDDTAPSSDLGWQRRLERVEPSLCHFLVLVNFDRLSIGERALAAATAVHHLGLFRLV
jgi:hypothetical protein